MEGGFWIRRATDAMRGAGEAMFPPNDAGAPDFEGVRLVERTLEWLDEMPPQSQRLVLLLFVFVEVGTGFPRFSRRSVVRREATIRRWRASKLFPIRLIGESLKATLSMIYLSHPDVLSYLGVYKWCAHPDDPIQIDVRARGSS